MAANARLRINAQAKLLAPAEADHHPSGGESSLNDSGLEPAIPIAGGGGIEHRAKFRFRMLRYFNTVITFVSRLNAAVTVKAPCFISSRISMAYKYFPLGTLSRL